MICLYNLYTQHLFTFLLFDEQKMEDKNYNEILKLKDFSI